MTQTLSPIICLMGPTASGKTPLALELINHLPCEIISVDSAMVYKEMNIGTAKPSKKILETIPHHLINICEPEEIYSAGRFREDALAAIEHITAAKKIPLLVGGSMLYFRVLQQGLALMPHADVTLRAQIQDKIKQQGLPAIYAELTEIDPIASTRIHQHDVKRISRALEIFYLTGQSITHWQKNETIPLSGYQIINIALMPSDRAQLHTRIEHRFQEMLKEGLIDEVQKLFNKDHLTDQSPSICTVNYAQVWQYLMGKESYESMCERALSATRQLAKRQMTWLRRWNDVSSFDIIESELLQKILLKISQILSFRTGF